MKYKVGDKVRIKSLGWYNENKGNDGIVEFSTSVFVPGMSQFCGKVVTIEAVYDEGDDDVIYCMEEIDYDWTEEMFDGLVEDENNRLTETVVDYVKESNDRYRIVIDPRFDIEVDEGEYYVVRRKKDYPKTYEECAMLLGLGVLNELKHYNLNILYKKDLIVSLQKLLICRDAYWKIAGEEMGLGKPWEPEDLRYVYSFFRWDGDITISNTCYGNNHIFEFPTEEMRDMFYENFKELIEICKEFL